MRKKLILLLAISLIVAMLTTACGIYSSYKETAGEAAKTSIEAGNAPLNSGKTDNSNLTMLFKRPIPNTEQSIIDKLNVIELIQYERFCRDNAMWEEMKKIYAENSTVTVSWFHGTGKEFVDASSKTNTYSQHKLYDTLVWINNNKAVSITMATIQLRSSVNGYPMELSSDVRLMCRTQKIDGVWYIISMDAIYEKDSLISVYPNSNITIPAEEMSKFRPSYASLSYFLSKQGLKVNNDLPGIDRPETINKLYQEADDWLNKE